MSQKESNISTFQTLLQQTLNHALHFLGTLDKKSVATTASLPDLHHSLNLPLPETQTDPKQVIDELVTKTNGGIIGNSSGRFFGWAMGGTLPAALAADWLTSTWNQNAALSACAPAEAVIEEVCGTWLKELLLLPSGSSFALVSGCQMAHVTCLAAARHALLGRCGWDCERDGLFGAPRIRVLSSCERHGSIDRAVRLLGLGSRCVVDLPADENGRLQSETLSKALAEHPPETPTIVLLQAGDLNIGAYDLFAELIPIAHRYSSNTWVHIDGAFGLWAAASPSHRHLLAGAEKADSWATDGHKWLNVPYDCGYAFVSDPEAHRNSMSHRASYLTHDDGGGSRDQIDWNPEWSRRGRGFATYAALRQLGREGVSDLVERCCRHAQSLLTRIGDLPEVELVWKSEINQGLVRFLDTGKPDAESKDHDRRTDWMIAALAETGEAFFSGTTWRGMRCMRVSVLNWQTDEDDVARVVTATERLLKQELTDAC